MCRAARMNPFVKGDPMPDPAPGYKSAAAALAYLFLQVFTGLGWLERVDTSTLETIGQGILACFAYGMAMKLERKAQ